MRREFEHRKAGKRTEAIRRTERVEVLGEICLPQMESRRQGKRVPTSRFDGAASSALLLGAFCLLTPLTPLPSSAARIPSREAASTLGRSREAQLQGVEESRSRVRSRDLMRRQKPWVYPAHQEEREGSGHVARELQGLQAVHSDAQYRSRSQYLATPRPRPELEAQPQPLLDGEEDSLGSRQVAPEGNLVGVPEYELAMAQSSAGGLPWTRAELLGEKEEGDDGGESRIASVVPQGLWGAFMRFFGWAYGQQGSDGQDDGEVSGAIFWVQPAAVSSSELRGRLHQLLMSDDIDADLNEVLAYLSLGDMEQMT